MRSFGFALTIAAGLLAAGAAPAQTAPLPGEELAAARAKVAAAAKAAREGTWTAAERAVVEADLAFAADAAARGAAAAFADRMHPEGRLLPAGQPLVVGPEAVRAAFAEDRARWEWAPLGAVAEGDVGATWGIAVISGERPGGEPFAVTTRYATVWKRDPTGAWKIWLDAGTAGPLP